VRFSSRAAGRAGSGTDRWRRRACSGGFLLLIAGLGWLVADRLLRGYFPLTWGGPNIGGGALVVVALLAAVAGAVLVGLNTSRREWGRRRSPRLAVGSWIGFAVTGALAVGMVVVLVVKPTDDPAAGVNGQVGVTVSATGSPVLVLEICRGTIDHVTISGPNRGGTPNLVLAQFDATQPATSTVLLDVLHPPVGWTGQAGSSLSTADPAELKIALGRGKQSELRQVDFTAADLKLLDVGTVQYSDSTNKHQVPMATFHSVACR